MLLKINKPSDSNGWRYNSYICQTFRGYIWHCSDVHTISWNFASYEKPRIESIRLSIILHQMSLLQTCKIAEYLFSFFEMTLELLLEISTCPKHVSLFLAMLTSYPIHCIICFLNYGSFQPYVTIFKGYCPGFLAYWTRGMDENQYRHPFFLPTYPWGFLEYKPQRSLDSYNINLTLEPNKIIYYIKKGRNDLPENFSFEYKIIQQREWRALLIP